MSLALPAAVQAQESRNFIDHPITVCDADPLANSPPDFTDPDCRMMLFYEADPQDRQIWIELIFDADTAMIEAGKPMGLFFSAKASSEAFLNSVTIGANGVPGTSALSEKPGDMDAVFFVPEGTLRATDNRLVMRLSSMNGGINLQSPIHAASIAPYRNPRQPGPATWFVLITFGLLIAACVYFGVDSIRAKQRRDSAVIAMIAFASAAQLAAEAARDIVPYPYPLHDLRLSLILTFAIALGLSCTAYGLLVLFRPQKKARLIALLALLGVMLMITLFQQGFDIKTVLVLLSASLAISAAGVVSRAQGNRNGQWFALGGAIIGVAIFALGGLFLDTLLYLLIAAFLLWMLVVRARGGGLPDLAAIQAPAPPKRIELSSNGKIEFVDTGEVIRFSGAGDYVEVFLKSGRSGLSNASLTALERELPDTFIRVHRSHIVNADHVQSLQRETAGTGELQMADGSSVPISRRNMASVKSALVER
ncbi:LytTR family transcriptional regulator [Erythrobacter insulae]|uniref:LytTR family transcriptional regulator n=1 Tax=Erythrobacter insulae TaxID=2584124 RepID=A0A547PCC4_9SPHN|nr:LytTR family DNA-binding domain-containing protein [Erythrobacter insulae]TRD11799.1 LytTR family transcriptional regulator [Erythrobacter insulae]